MKQTKHILILTAWYPSPDNIFSGSFVRDQTEMWHTYFNLFDKTTEYKFCILHTAPPIDLANYIFRGKRPYRETTYEAGTNIPVVHEQALIPSHRTSFLKEKCIYKGLGHGWNKAINQIGKQPDIIIAVTLTGLLAAAKLFDKKKLKIPLILHEHSVPITMHIKGAQDKLLSEKWLRHINEVIVVADRQITEIETISGRSNIRKIWNPANAIFFSTELIPSDFPDAFNIVTVGHLNAQKAQARLIKAMALLCREHIDNVVLTIAGDGENKAALVQLAEDLGVKGKVVFKGAVSKEEVATLLKDASIFALVSRYENCPVALIEAQAMGVPCLCTENGASEKILLPGNGISVKQDEEGLEVARGIKNLINNYSGYNREQIRETARKHFSPEVFSRQFYDIISSLIR